MAAVAGGAGAGSPCGNAWIVYHGMGGKSGVGNGGSEGGRGTEEGGVKGGAVGGRACGTTTRLRPRFVCEGMGMEAPLATAAWCVRTSAFFAADRASGSARFPELTPPL